MRKISIGQAWTESLAFLGAEGRIVWAVALALIALPAALIESVAPSAGAAASPPIWLSLLNFVLTLVMLVGQLALTRLALRPGESAGGALALASRRIWPLFGAMLLVIAPAVVILSILLVALVGATPSPQALATNPASALVLFVTVVLFVWFGARVIMITPTAMNERGGPVVLLRRAFALSRGNLLRILAFLLLFGATVLVSLYVVTGIVAPAIGLLLGPVTSLSPAALVGGLLVGLVQMGVAVINGVMTARLYAQANATAGDSWGAA
ncbi:hypothetical protein ABDK56_00295 [Sphingomonas sp. ASV193]|uniref:hypothetical protein n=1 Tax=Sphingomonas sp. ASV193 TaxID=3144405 RepID=UPI0032E87173